HVNSLLFNGLVETFSQVPGDYTSEQIADFVLAQEAEEMETLVKQFGYSVLSKVDFRTYKRVMDFIASDEYASVLQAIEEASPAISDKFVQMEIDFSEAHAEQYMEAVFKASTEDIEATADAAGVQDTEMREALKGFLEKEMSKLLGKMKGV
ncbi:TPA: hypothetical protein NIB99_004238, partial [Pseudomonas aeruginosa]|nr:hypothetical protein [Pseudomonas aeruginosa]